MISSWEPTLNTFILIIGLFTQLAALIFLAGKFTTRVDSLEKRVSDSEGAIRSYQEETASILSIEVNLKSLSDEVSYVRKRLDSFVDKGMIINER